MLLPAVSASGLPKITKRVNVGIIGCGNVAQIIHIPTLGFLSALYKITYLCDVSEKALLLCQTRVSGPDPAITKDAAELCSSPDVDVVFVVNSDEYHAEHAVLALRHKKDVFIEKPVALNLRDIQAIQAAEKEFGGKVMVGYMRRYAPAFVDVIKEIGSMEKILYARVRDIIGPNSHFIGQSGTFPQLFDDIDEADLQDKSSKAREMVQQALTEECNVSVGDQATWTWRLLNGLGTHDISVMREAFGMPQKVLGAHPGNPFWSVLFQYDGFAVSYESGIDSVPRFDAHIEVYGQNKTVKIQYDTPFVKGLPIQLHVCENVDGVYQERLVRKTYEDPYTIEMKELYNFLEHNEPVKTTLDDAKQDTEIFQMVIKAAYAR